MQLLNKKLLSLIDSVIVLEKADKKEIYDSKSAIPEELMNHIVKTIKPENNSILIILSEPLKTKNLENLGYSFEAGM
jgi:hypothetical protein